MSSERNFFQAMEEFGFFSHIYDHLPHDITAVFEIARVLEDESSALSQALSNVLKLPAPDYTGITGLSDAFSREITVGEEYEADLIQSHRDIARIYPWQHMLPDELFYQRVAERTLWMPIAKAPRILPIEDVKQAFGFDSRKQKVYVLFDTSSSMRSHYRIYLAKAILYTFLKRNKEEMGFISLRTFDDRVGEVHTAIDEASYDALLRHTLRLTHLGEGTVLQKALLQALEDIHAMEHLAGAEILIITDGAVSLDEDLIRAKLDDHIRIHTLKIGHVEIYPSESLIEDQIRTNTRFGDKQYTDLVRQESEVLHSLKHTEAHQKHEQLGRTLSSVRAQMQKKHEELAGKFLASYGHELQHLSSIYLNIGDLNERDLFGANEETIADLESLATSLEAEAHEFFTPDITKKLAILHDHICFLLKYEANDALRARLIEMDAHLKALLGSFIGAPRAGGAKPEGSVGQTNVALSEEDLRDLHFLLEMGSGEGEMQIMLLIRWLWKTTYGRIASALRRRRMG
jgi:hypothetical protein